MYELHLGDCQPVFTAAVAVEQMWLKIVKVYSHHSNLSKAYAGCTKVLRSLPSIRTDSCSDEKVRNWLGK